MKCQCVNFASLQLDGEFHREKLNFSQVVAA